MKDHPVIYIAIIIAIGVIVTSIIVGLITIQRRVKEALEEIMSFY